MAVLDQANVLQNESTYSSGVSSTHTHMGEDSLLTVLTATSVLRVSLFSVYTPGKVRIPLYTRPNAPVGKDRGKGGEEQGQEHVRYICPCT